MLQSSRAEVVLQISSEKQNPHSSPTPFPGKGTVLPLMCTLCECCVSTAQSFLQSKAFPPQVPEMIARTTACSLRQEVTWPKKHSYMVGRPVLPCSRLLSCLLGYLQCVKAELERHSHSGSCSQGESSLSQCAPSRLSQYAQGHPLPSL